MEKRNWNQKSGTGWKRDPKDNLWYQYKNWKKTGKTQKTLLHNNWFVGAAYRGKQLSKWWNEGNKEFYKNLEEYKKSQTEKGLVYDSGKWVKGPDYEEKQKLLKLKEKDNKLKKKYKQVSEDDVKNYLKIKKEGTNENKDKNEKKNLKINKEETNNNVNKDKGKTVVKEETNNNVNNTKNKEVKTNNNLKVKPKFFTFKGKRYRSGSVGARKVENILAAKQRAKDMAKQRLGIL